MNNALKWVIILLAVALLGLLVYLSGELFGVTLGPVPTFIIFAVIMGVGIKWTKPKEDVSVVDDSESAES